MTIEQVGRAQCIVACIESAERNIERYKELSALPEIALVDKSNASNTVYVTGDTLKAMMEIPIKHWEEFKAKHEKELAKL